MRTRGRKGEECGEHSVALKRYSNRADPDRLSTTFLIGREWTDIGLQKKEMENITTAILTDMITIVERIDAIPILAYLPRAREIAKDIAVTQDEEYMFSICRLNAKAKCFSTRPYFAEKIANGKTLPGDGNRGYLASYRREEQADPEEAKVSVREHLPRRHFAFHGYEYEFTGHC